MKKNAHLTFVVAMTLVCSLLTSCATNSYDNFSFPEKEDSVLVKVADYSRKTDYDNDAPYDPTVTTVSSSDGLCVMEVKEHYFDITLDLEKGDHYSVGKAYGEVLRMVAGDCFSSMESYLYENARYFFNNVDDSTYEELGKRTASLYSSLPKDYQDEIRGLSEMVTDSKGFVEDGVLSYDEMILAQFIPDALRGSACSAVSLDGERTESGKRITSRLLEWPTGTKSQVANMHAVVHYIHGESSFVSVGVLGVLTPFSLMSSHGVVIGMLDVGSDDTAFTCENKASYTFGMRYAIENTTTAREASEYMAEHAYEYTYCANIFVTDEKDAFCVEMPVTPENGKPIIRSKETPIFSTLPNTAENCIYVVNGFVCEGHKDIVTYKLGNRIRWERFDSWFTGNMKFSLETFKEIMTCENTERAMQVVGNNDSAFHWVIADYDTRTIQASFTVADPKGDAPVLYTVAQF